jgi:hypothetical protein
MAKGYKHGAGGAGGAGAGLNFEVKAYATEVLLRADTPKENTIGVVTGTPITGWIFSATQPDAITEGLVWFLTGTDSAVEFNALKKNSVKVYPISAKQYVDGAWVDKTAKSYPGGEWVDWVTYLFNGGDTCDGITGGWTNSGYSYTGTVDGSSKTYTNVSPTIGETIKVSVGKEIKVAIAGTVNKIDLTDVKTIIVDIDSVVGQAFVRVCSTKAVNSDPKASLSLGSAVSGTTSKLDVSSLSGSYYIAIFTYGSTGASSGRSATIKKVWLEK